MVDGMEVLRHTLQNDARELDDKLAEAQTHIDATTGEQCRYSRKLMI
jgi:hypothetical protein